MLAVIGVLGVKRKRFRRPRGKEGWGKEEKSEERMVNAENIFYNSNGRTG